MTTLFPTYITTQPIYGNPLERSVYRIARYFSHSKEEVTVLYAYGLKKMQIQSQDKRQTLIIIYRLIKNKEKIDFEQEIIKHRPAMLKRALSKVHDTEEANELVQAAILRALRYFKKHGIRKDNIAAFLCRIVDTIFLDECRKRKIRIEAAPTLAEDDTVVNTGERSFLKSNIAACVESLPTLQKKIVMMFMNGYEPRDIAKELKVKERFVEEVKENAFDTLRKLLKADREA